MMRPSQVKIGLLVLFVTIIVPLLTVTVIRGYLQYLWAKKRDMESSESSNTTIFDIIQDPNNYLWRFFIPLHKMTLHPTADVTFTPSFTDDIPQSSEAVSMHHRIRHDSQPIGV